MYSVSHLVFCYFLSKIVEEKAAEFTDEYFATKSWYFFIVFFE